MTATAIGLLVKKRCETARWHIGRVVSIVSGDTVDITELSDGDDWPDEGGGTYDWGIGAKVFRAVAKGTAIGEWQELADPAVADVAAAASSASSAASAASSAASSASSSASAAASAASAAQATADAALAAPGSPQAVSLTLGAASGTQLDAARPCLLVVRGTGAPTLSATGSQAYTVQLLTGSTASGPAPSTVVDDAQGALAATLLVGITTTATEPWKLVTIVPAGEYVRVVQSAGAATCAITAATKQVM
jgi:hypothetical protein